MSSNVPPMQGQQTMSSMQGQQTTRPMQGQPVTGMPDHVYDLVSIIYHAMKSGATTQSYIQDAQQSGDNDLLVFFQQVQQDDRMRVQRAQQLLAQKLASVPPAH